MRKTSRVLLIEPGFYARVDYDDQLDPFGFQVESVRDVKSALIKLKAQIFQAIVISYEEDLRGALNLLTTLREAGNQLPVLLLTKVPTQEQVMILRKFGNLEMLVKPIAPAVLSSRLNALIEAAKS